MAAPSDGSAASRAEATPDPAPTRTRFCPSCFRSYESSVSVCEVDGTALLAVGAGAEPVAPPKPVVAPKLPEMAVAPARKSSGRQGSSFLRQRREDLRAGAVALGVVVLLAIPIAYVAWPRSERLTAPAAASEADQRLLAEGEPAEEPVIESREFANAQMRMGIAMKEFERAFEAWAVSGGSGPDAEQAVARMRASQVKLRPEIAVASHWRPPHERLWRAHAHLQQALILNATGSRKMIRAHVEEAAALFESLRSTRDPLARSDLVESLRNASGTYRFLFGTPDDPLFQPILESLPNLP